MMWYLNPKNWLIIVCVVIGIVSSGLYLWQRNTVVKQSAEIKALVNQNDELLNQVKSYKKNIAAMKKTQQEQQAIADETAQLLAEAQQITTNCLIGGNDEEKLSDFTYFFNHGMLREDSGSTTGGKVLPEAGAPGVERPRWTVKALAENYITLIGYALSLEKTVNCYETP